MRKEKYYVLRSEKNSKWLYYVFIGIAAFILIYFPFFAMNLRYQVGAVFSKLFDAFGMVCLGMGGIFSLISLFNLFGKGKINIKFLVLGVVLVWIGCWCTGRVVELFWVIIGNEPPNPGYH